MPEGPEETVDDAGNGTEDEEATLARASTEKFKGKQREDM